MCDFRQPPTGIQIVETSEILPCEYKGCVNLSSYPSKNPSRQDVVEPGMYYMCATGSYYSYFDGKEWWIDRGEIEKECYTEQCLTFIEYYKDRQIPKCYTSYRFLFPSNMDCHQHV